APTTVAQLRRRLYRDAPPPRSIVPSMPTWLQEVILRCLEVDPGERYASAAQIAFDLANPGQVALTERAQRRARAGVARTARRWAKPLALPEERVTYHVLESDKPVAALLDYATVNEVEEILLGPGRDAAELVTQAPCTVTVVRAPTPG